MKMHSTDIPEVLVIEPKLFQDSRGFFMESYHRGRYMAKGLEYEFVQDNVSRSASGVLRGLHIQNPHLQGKLVTALSGRIIDVAADVRVGSPTFGKHVKVMSRRGQPKTVLDPSGIRPWFPGAIGNSGRLL